jgi:predicted ATPase
MTLKTKKNLLIGGPGTGKSSTLNQLEQNGCVCYPEIAREITIEAQKKGVDQLFISDPLAFSNALLEGRIQQYREASSVNDKAVYIDRGIPDVSAYLDYANQAYPAKYNEANLNYRYDQVFHFPIWDDIFMSDNERYESLIEAKKIDIHIVQKYTQLGYHLIEVPKGSIIERANFILEHS